jgi:hypothetical protein
MLRDNLAGLIEPMRSSAGANPLPLCIAKNESSDDRPPCLENPRPEGAESTLTENGASPFHAEPRQTDAIETTLCALQALKNCLKSNTKTADGLPELVKLFPD